MALVTVTASTARRFHMARRRPGARAHRSEISCTNGVSYPLLAETREGYRNLCRLVTRMKLRAKKGEGAATLDDLAEFARGLICITRHADERLLEIFGSAIFMPTCNATTSVEKRLKIRRLWSARRRLGIPLVPRTIRLRHGRAARAARCLHLRAQ